MSRVKIKVDLSLVKNDVQRIMDELTALRNKTDNEKRDGIERAIEQLRTLNAGIRSFDSEIV